MAVERQPPELLIEEVMASSTPLGLEFGIQMRAEIAVVGQNRDTPG
jgi:hypothetical protein